MGAFDSYNQATGNVPPKPIHPTAELCPDKECKYWDGANCVFAECRYTVPELITPRMAKPCIICGGNRASRSPRSDAYVCESCKSGIARAIILAHNPGSD